MSQMKLLLSSTSVVLVTLGLLFSVACGGGSSSMNQNLSAAQAQAVSQEFATAAEAALQASITGSAQRNRQNFGGIFSAAAKRDAISDATGSCVTSASGTSCNYPVSYSGSCPQGGTIGVNGDFDFTLNSAGDGSDSSTLTISPSACQVSNVTINGNPDVMFAVQLSFQNDAPVYPITLTESGGISYGPNPSGSCSVNATLTITSETSCAISGTICGQTLSGDCLPATN